MATRPKAPRKPTVADFGIEVWPTDRPTPYERNNKVHTPERVAKLARVIEATQQLVPIVVDKHGVIIKGHRTQLALQLLGWPYALVRVARHLSPAAVKAQRLADNRLGKDSPDNEEAIRSELVDLRAMNFDLSMTGFELPEIGKMIPDFTQGGSDGEGGEGQGSGGGGAPLPPKGADDQWLCVVTCRDEEQLQKLYEELSGRGLECKMVT